MTLQRRRDIINIIQEATITVKFGIHLPADRVHSVIFISRLTIPITLAQGI